jgi:hypothetical protein
MGGQAALGLEMAQECRNVHAHSLVRPAMRN